MTRESPHFIPAFSLPQSPAPDGYRLRDVQLELSLKPFFDNTPETREHVCAEVFHQWQALWRYGESVSILLWIAEGSEILEYAGDLDAEFEWARYHGSPNKHRWEMPKASQPSENPDHAGIGINAAERDPEGRGLHSRAYLYRDEPARFNYRWLRDLVSDLKRIGEAITGRTILVGDAFDIGPEFALSRFKYDWHREILSDGPVFKEQFISCEGVLSADDRRYAGFPDGIPEGTSVGRFLGRQAHCLLRDCGMDFFWLSNGFGFSLEPWAMVGRIFDGMEFRGEDAPGTAERVLRFWKDLRSELPKAYRIRTRGTNLATGIDLGSDASPLRGIYEGDFGVDAPVNSPWAALDGDFGLELTGWMSHLVRHPGDAFRFRFYTHDPWWLNSPWLDRYQRRPHDLYLPLSVAHMLRDGSVEIPRDIAFLSVDDSNGCMPPSVPNEVIGHLLRARERAPDAAGPLVWGYPFDEFHRMALESGCPERPFHADAFLGAAFNDGFPLNTVADLEALHGLAKRDPGAGVGSVFVVPVPEAGSEAEGAVEEMIAAGWDLLLFGPLAPESRVAERLNVAFADPVEGDFSVDFDGQLGVELGDGTRRIRHTALLSAGGMREVATESTRSLALARREDEERVLAARADGAKGGSLAWFRASLTTAEWNPDAPAPIRGPILRPLDPATFFPAGVLARRMLRCFGWRILSECAPGESRPPCLTVHRHRNAFIFSGYHRNPYSVLQLRHPMGAPLLAGRHQWVLDGVTQVTGEVAWQAEARAFVESGEDSLVECRDLQPCMHGVNRRILLSGLQGARIQILPDPEYLATLKLLRDPYFPYFHGDFVDVPVLETAWGPAVTVENVTGELLIEW